MEVRGICFGDEIGGRAFLASMGTKLVEVCFEDHGRRKDERESLFVCVSQYMDFEEIRLSDQALFSRFVDSDNEFDKDEMDKAVIEFYGDEISSDYHEDIKAEISESLYAKEIALARHVMDLFSAENYGAIGELFGKEADEFDVPEVKYDRTD